MNPAAIVSASLGVLFYSSNLNRFRTNDIRPESLEFYLNPTISGLLIDVGSSLWIRSFLKYRNIKKGLREWEISKEYVERNLKHYCDKQAFKVATISKDLRKEFDEFNKNFPNERKRFGWIPEF